MRGGTRRSPIRGSAGLAEAVAPPYLANTSATTATAWWAQGVAERQRDRLQHHVLCAAAPEDRLARLAGIEAKPISRHQTERRRR